MMRRQFTRAMLMSIGASACLAIDADAQSASQPRKPDLGDAAAGTYFGEVISDSKGSSKSDVTLTVTRIDKDVVRVASDYPRLPVVDVALTRAMGKILQRRGNTVFLLDPSNAHLDVSFLNEVSWSGSKR